MNSLFFHLHNVRSTCKVASLLSRASRRGDVICLHGCVSPKICSPQSCLRPRNAISAETRDCIHPSAAIRVDCCWFDASGPSAWERANSFGTLSARECCSQRCSFPRPPLRSSNRIPFPILICGARQRDLLLHSKGHHIFSPSRTILTGCTPDLSTSRLDRTQTAPPRPLPHPFHRRVRVARAARRVRRRRDAHRVVGPHPRALARRPPRAHVD